MHLKLLDLRYQTRSCPLCLLLLFLGGHRPNPHQHILIVSRAFPLLRKALSFVRLRDDKLVTFLLLAHKLNSPIEFAVVLRQVEHFLLAVEVYLLRIVHLHLLQSVAIFLSADALDIASLELAVFAVFLFLLVLVDDIFLDIQFVFEVFYVVGEALVDVLEVCVFIEKFFVGIKCFLQLFSHLFDLERT